MLDYKKDKKQIFVTLDDLGTYEEYSFLTFRYLKKKIEEIEKEHGEDCEEISIAFMPTSFSKSIYNLIIRGTRFETEEEFNVRVEESKEEQKQKALKERRQYEILKAKFEKGN